MPRKSKNLQNQSAFHLVDPVTRFQQIRRGSWYDINIAAGAAYADVFVSNDIPLREMCNLLRDKSVIGFSSVSYDQLFQNEGGRPTPL
jgi:hypothetical protein